MINGSFTEKNHPNILNLALRYVLWRVKTREHYKIEQFYPTPRCIEIRDARHIPLLQQIKDPLFIPDHKFSYRTYTSHRAGDAGSSEVVLKEIPLPDTPRLKKAATLDVLMLCRSVEVKADHSKYRYHCSCTSHSNDYIYFAADPIAAIES